MSHPPGKIAIGGADAFHRRIHPAKSVHRSAQACGATGVLGHLDTGIEENLPDALAVPSGGLEVMNDFGCCRDAKSVNRDAFAAQDAGELKEVAGFTARAGTDVGAVEFHRAEFFGEFALARVRMAGDGRLEF